MRLILIVYRLGGTTSYVNDAFIGSLPLPPSPHVVTPGTQANVVHVYVKETAVLPDTT